MSKTYELWDAGTRNLVGTHSSEADAFAFIRAYADQHGPAYPSSWVLLWDDEDADAAGQIAEGQALLALAGVSMNAEGQTEAARHLVTLMRSGAGDPPPG